MATLESLVTPFTQQTFTEQRSLIQQMRESRKIFKARMKAKKSKQAQKKTLHELVNELSAEQRENLLNELKGLS